MPHPPELTLLLHRALEPRLGRLLDLCGTQGWQADPEGLHQVRVASRRVRAVLDLLDPATCPGFKRHARRLRRLTKALGLTRELDVHAARLEGLTELLPGSLRAAASEHLLEELERRRSKARAQMSRDLARTPLRGLERLRVEAGTGAPPAATGLGPAVWACLEPWVHAVESPLPPLLLEEDALGLHRLRIQVKRLRYTLEVLEAAFPSPLEDWLARLRDLQTCLGEYHDLAVLEAFLLEARAGLATRRRSALAAGVLELADLVGEARRTRYARFQDLGRALGEAAPRERLKQLLDDTE